MSITLPLPTTIPDLLAGLLNRTPCSAALSWREAGYWRRLATEEVARFGIKQDDLTLSADRE